MTITLGDLICIPCNARDHSSSDSFRYLSFHALFRAETAALVREILRRCCAQRAEMVRFGKDSLDPVEMRLAGFVSRLIWNPGLVSSIWCSLSWGKYLFTLAVLIFRRMVSLHSNVFPSVSWCLLQESPLDENLPAINVIVTITGKFFQQAEAIYWLGQGALLPSKAVDVIWDKHFVVCWVSICPVLRSNNLLLRKLERVSKEIDLSFLRYPPLPFPSPFYTPWRTWWAFFSIPGFGAFLKMTYSWDSFSLFLGSIFSCRSFLGAQKKDTVVLQLVPPGLWPFL